MANIGSKYPLPLTSSVTQSVAPSVSVGVTGVGAFEEQAPIIDAVTILGDLRIGDTLTSAVVYTQPPIPSGTEVYQWQRDAVNISGANDSTYILTVADAGAAITLNFSVTNSSGSDSATSNTLNAEAISAPSITGVPTFTGIPYEGNTLVAVAASPVTGNPPPTTFWQWQRDSVDIPGATNSSYTVVNADNGYDIRVVQSEINSQGSDTAASAAQAVQSDPVISGVPTFSGTENVGQRLTATPTLTVTGEPTPTRSFEWQRSSDGLTGWTSISGATTRVYELSAEDEGNYIRVSQIETNNAGGATRADSAESVASGAIGAALTDPYMVNGVYPPTVADYAGALNAGTPLYRANGVATTFAALHTTASKAGGLATQVDATGNVTWNSHNGLKQSSGFSNSAWIKTQVSVVSNVGTAAPDGTLTADRIVPTTASGSHNTYQTASADLDTFAVFARADGYGYIQMFSNIGGDGWINFNLSSGAIGNSSILTGSISAVGNGWYLCVATGFNGSNTFVNVMDTDSTGRNPAFTGDGSSGVLLWGAHRYRTDLGGMADVPSDERGLVTATKYLPTTSSARYLLRRDHHRYDGAEWVRAGVLIEPVASTNAVLDCRDLSTANWTRRGTGAVVSTTGVSGEVGAASRITVDTGTNDVIESATGGGRFANDAVLAVSAFVKPVSGTGDLQITNAVTAANGSWTVDLSLLSSSTYTRVYAGHPAVTVNNAFTATATGQASVRFLSTSGALDVDVDIVQIEEGASVISSPILTAGAPVTRLADLLRIPGANMPNSEYAQSLAMAGRVTYADTLPDTSSQEFFFKRGSGGDLFETRINTSGTSVGRVQTRVKDDNKTTTNDVPTELSPGVNVPYRIANRALAGELQSAIDASASTATTNPLQVALPELSSSEVTLGNAQRGGSHQFDLVRVYFDDIAEAGIKEATAGIEITGLPTISGREAVTRVLTATPAPATGAPSPVTTTYQWQRSANGSTGWTDISGATSSTYTLANSEDSQYVRVVQTSSVTVDGKATFTDTANSASTGLIQTADFVMTVRTTSSNESFEIPCQNTGTFDCVVDWGDGDTSTITSYNDPDLEHTYASSGTHTIRIRGTFPNIYFNFGGDRLKLRTIENLGVVGWQTLADAFEGCINLTDFTAGNSDTSAVTSMEEMFEQCANLATCDLSNMDTSSCTLMFLMFQNCRDLTSLDFSSFDVSNVTRMDQMFEDCLDLASINFGTNWSTDSLLECDRMFTRCRSLTSLNLTGFILSQVDSLGAMFEECQALTTLDVSMLDTSDCNDFARMFANCYTLQTLDVSTFDTQDALTFKEMFRNCFALTALDVSGFDTSKATNIAGMFEDCSSITSIDVSNFDTSNVTRMEDVFQGMALTTLNVSNFDTSNVTAMDDMFKDLPNLTSLDLSSFDTSSVTIMSEMFNGNTSLASLNLGSNWDTSNVTNMFQMFHNCSSLTDVRADLFDISSVTNLTEFADGCTLSTARYDAILVAWDAQTVNSGLSTSFGSSQYTASSAASAARASLISNDGWTISDGGAV